MKRCAAGIALCVLSSLLLVAGCKHSPRPKDTAASPRIVTFSPSLTDLMFDMGMGDHVVGAASQSDVPPDRNIPIVGDEQTVNTETVLIARPDVLLVQSDPKLFVRVCEGDSNIRMEHFVLNKTEDIALAAERIARIAGHEDVGKKTAAAFLSDLTAIRRKADGKPHPRVLFVRDYKQPYAAGRNTLLNEMIQIAGGTNVAAERWEGWAAVNAEHIMAVHPDVLICLATPDEAQQAREYWADVKGLPASQKGRVFVVSDPNWLHSSTRLAKITALLAEMIHSAPASAPVPTSTSKGASE